MIDQSTLQTYIDNIDKDVNEFTEITNNIIKKQSSDLDSLMQDLKSAVTQPDAVSTDAVERYYAELTNLLYFMAERLNKLSIYKDISKATSKEAYNNKYVTYSSEKDEKGKSIRTVNENVALAESTTQYEATVATIYSSAYDALRIKYDAAQEMVTTLKNILKRRVNEEYINYQLSNMKFEMDNNPAD